MDLSELPLPIFLSSYPTTTMAARDFPTIKAIRSYVIGGVGSGEHESDNENALSPFEMNEQRSDIPQAVTTTM